ncbi:hypothetical protein PFISCL1PPCAC_3431, partial [Pristionchus fissidentatus]
SVDYNTDYLFGMSDANWRDIISKMFDRKMDSLCVDTRRQFAFLSRLTRNVLTENLCSIDNKKIRLALSFANFWQKASENDSEINDYEITGTNNGIDIFGRFSAFYITHKEREKLMYYDF